MFVQEVSEFRSKSVSTVLTTIGAEEEFFGLLSHLNHCQKLIFFFPTNDLASLLCRMHSCLRLKRIAYL